MLVNRLALTRAPVRGSAGGTVITAPGILPVLREDSGPRYEHQEGYAEPACGTGVRLSLLARTRVLP